MLIGIESKPALRNNAKVQEFVHSMELFMESKKEVSTKEVAPEYVGKVVIANSGTGKTVASKDFTSVVDGDSVEHEMSMEEFQKELNLSNDIDLKSDSLLQEIFKANKEVVSNLDNIDPTKVVVTDSVDGGYYEVTPNIVKLNPSRLFNRITIAHEFIHSLQQKMRYEQLSSKSQQFIRKSITDFKTLKHGVINSDEFKEIDTALKTGNLKGVISKYSRSKLEYGYLAHIANGHYNSPEPISEYIINNRFGREYTAIMGSSPEFRSAIYKATDSNEKAKVKFTINDILKAIKNVASLVKSLVKEDTGKFNNDPDYRNGIELLDEYLNAVSKDDSMGFTLNQLNPISGVSSTTSNINSMIKKYKGCK